MVRKSPRDGHQRADVLGLSPAELRKIDKPQLAFPKQIARRLCISEIVDAWREICKIARGSLWIARCCSSNQQAGLNCRSLACRDPLRVVQLPDNGVRNSDPMLKKQLLDSSRGRIVTLLRRGALTADDIASELRVTRSAIRAQITGMERDGVVRRAGQRPGTTRPSHVFELTPEVEQLLSSAYIPLLTRLVDVFAAGLPAAQLETMLRQAGKQLADELARGKRPAGNLASRVAMASEMMNEQLGATTQVERNGGYIIRGFGCPLAALTGKHPGVCLAIESLIAEVLRVPVRECCDRAERPKCCFEIGSRAEGHQTTAGRVARGTRR